jgi:ketosteroid isomerase-like protein
LDQIAPGWSCKTRLDTSDVINPANIEVDAMNSQPYRTSRKMTLKAAALMPIVLASISMPAQAQQAPTGDRPSHTEVNATHTQSSRTAQVIDRFNQAFIRHDASLLKELIAEDCVMESVEPAPNGTRVVGRAANLALWQNLANDKAGAFAVEDVVVFGDRANIRWRYRSGPGLSQSVRGVTLMRLRDGLIVEALAYTKTGDAPVATAVRKASGSEPR